MTIYLIIGIISAFFAEKSVKTKKIIKQNIYKLFAIVLPTLLYTFRFGIGTDYFNYVKIFYRAQNGYQSRIEWGYYYLNVLIIKLGGNFQTVSFVTCFIMMYFVYLAIKNYEKYISVGVGFFVYLMLFYQMSYNMVRHNLTMAICLYSLSFIEKRKFINFIILVFLASSIHNSGYLMIPLYFLYPLFEKKGRIFAKIFTYMIVFIFVFNVDRFLMPIFESIDDFEYYSKYLIGGDESSFSLSFLIRHLPFVIIGIYLYKKAAKIDLRFTFIIYIYIISLILTMTNLIGTQYIGRMALNYQIVLTILIPYYIKIFNEKKEHLASCFVIGYVILNWWYVYIFVGSHGTYPYRWIFDL